METTTSRYVGRFAPSPTGPLHFGSLVTAVASYLEARSRNGRWLLRIEDLDPPREVPGATGMILEALEAYGLEWDGAVVLQSRRARAYGAALEVLESRDLTYRCGCSRRSLIETATAGTHGPIYPGTCRSGTASDLDEFAVRIRTNNKPIRFKDLNLGLVEQELESEVGDFIVRRRDGYYAYQLAVVVDDAWQGVTDVVRGSDLLSSTPRQIHLQHLLGLQTPRYLHVPVVANTQGGKLSKQTGAQALPLDNPGPPLLEALKFLDQAPPESLIGAPVSEIWRWALAYWRAQDLPRCESKILGHDLKPYGEPT
ncbi:MAG: tRNA glutamyl-Q(34) synthetase GluQRS [Gammaproteobacteria bacterium]|jgi:glutamyl-Q tRNA(Asp) synthetase|nr:tRNA glutamyl-Q(34) synthetase GluQRS [Gammaproteobacteria bacterium]